MKPCDNCLKKDHCSVAAFIMRNCDRSPWDVSNALYDNYHNVSIISMASGDPESIVVECGDYNPIRAEGDYSNPTRRSQEPKHTSPPPKCGKCKGKCGK
jgi:hypothetical protein